MTLTLVDFFCGAGGSSQGAAAVPGIGVRLAANHWERAIESHAQNFPDTEHFRGDLHDADVAKFPAGDLFWASPECPQWSVAKGVQRTFDRQPDLFGETLSDEAADRSRALMWDVPRYLNAMKLRGRPVLAGVVENVVEVRKWIHWQEWRDSIRNLGYRTKLVAMNSMHARPSVVPGAPQSRDRLYLAYWLESIGRDPDWDKWLRPPAWCPVCEAVVKAVQVWKRPGTDMGRYRSQYVYRCPNAKCRNAVVEPAVLPAAAAIDWTDLGTRIGDRPRPMKQATRDRIAAGLKRYARPVALPAAPPETVGCPPLIVPAGGTWRTGAASGEDPFSARTTRENDGVAFPPFVTVHRGGEGDSRTSPIDGALTSVTASGNHLGLAVPPFLVPLRSGRPRTIPVTEPTATVVADGGNHGLVIDAAMIMRNNTDRSPDQGHMSTPASEPLRTVTTLGHQSLVSWPHLVNPDAAMLMRNYTARGDQGQMSTRVTEPARTLTAEGNQSLVSWQHLLVPYYGNSEAGRPVYEPVGTLSTRDRYGLATGGLEIDVDDVLFRMLKPPEIGRAMAFGDAYVVLGTQREKVRQYGNAVTPPVAEVLFSALMEAIDGEDREVAA